MAWDPSALFTAGEKGGWYDVGDLATLFQDVAGTIPAVVGSPVALIKDRSPNGLDLSQATGADCPTLQQVTGGPYYLSFNGTANFVQNASTTFDFLSVFSLCLGVLQPSAAASAFAPLTGRSAGSTGWDLSMTAATLPALPQPRMTLRGTTIHDTTFTLPVSSDVPHTVTGECSATAITMSIDGTRQTSTAAWASATSTANLIVGGRFTADAGNLWTGRIYTYVLVNRALTATERTNLEAWTASRYTPGQVNALAVAGTVKNLVAGPPDNTLRVAGTVKHLVAGPPDNTLRVAGLVKMIVVGPSTIVPSQAMLGTF